MRHIKRLALVGMVVLWLGGFLLKAPSPLYRWLYLQSKDIPLEAPYELFETIKWSHPYYYGDLAHAFRDLAQQTISDTIYIYFDLESDINTRLYISYFKEYALIWAYPRRVEIVGNLAEIPQGGSLIISSTIVPDLICQVGEENLYLCL